MKKIIMFLLSFAICGLNEHFVHAAEVPRETPKKVPAEKAVSELEKFLPVHPDEREAILQSVSYSDLLNLARSTINKDMLEAMKAEIEKRSLVAYWAKGQIPTEDILVSRSSLSYQAAGPIKSVAFSPNGLFVAGGSERRYVVIFDMKNQEFINQPQHDGNVFAVGFTAGGQLLTFEVAPATVRLSDVLTGKELSVFPISIKGIDRINTAAFSSNGQLLAIGFVDGATKLWDVQKDREVQTFALPYLPEPVELAYFAERLSEVEREQLKTLFPVLALALSPDGRQLAVSYHLPAGEKPSIVLFNVQTGKEIKKLTDFEMRAVSIAFSPDSQLLAVDDSINKIFVEIKSGEKIRTIRRGGPGRRDSAIAFSHDGKQLAVGQESGLMSVLSVIHPEKKVQPEKKRWWFF